MAPKRAPKMDPKRGPKVDAKGDPTMAPKRTPSGYGLTVVSRNACWVAPALVDKWADKDCWTDCNELWPVESIILSLDTSLAEITVSPIS